MGFLDFTDADLIALTRQRRLELYARREIEAAHAKASSHMKARKARSETVYYGGSKSIIAFKESAPTPVERSIKRNGQKVASERRKAAEAARAHKYRRIYELQNGRCYLCGDPFESQAEATDDHVTPKAHGGKRTANILHACKACNNAKGHRKPHPCELVYLDAINRRLPRHDLKRASGKHVELAPFIPLRQRLAAQAAE